MTISFTASVLASAAAPAVAVSVRHLAAFRAFARECDDSFCDEGDEFLAYNFEARVGPWSLASICAIFDHDPGVIAVVEEAQFRGLNIRFWRNETTGTVMMGVAKSLDGSASIDLSNANAFALLDALASTVTPAAGLRVSDLRSMVSDPEKRNRLIDDGLGRYATQLQRLAEVERSEDQVHVVWG